MIKGNFDIPLDFLSAKAPPLIGVDVCSSSVKIVELSKLPKDAGYVVERYAIEPLPKDAVSERNIPDARPHAFPGTLHTVCNRFQIIDVALADCVFGQRLDGVSLDYVTRILR